MFLGDFHIHSTFSDGRLTIPQIVDLYGSHGFGCIAITDHLCETNSFIGRASRHLGLTLTRASYPLYREILASETRRAAKQYDMIVLPGVEFTKNAITGSQSAHLLSIGFDPPYFVDADADIRKLIEIVHDHNGLAIAAHPLKTRADYFWLHRDEFRDQLDAWEIASGEGAFFPEVAEHKLPFIANSDLHRRSQFASWKTVFTCPKNSEDILQAIRKQDINLHYFQEVPHVDAHFPAQPVVRRHHPPHHIGDGFHIARPAY